MKSMRAKKEEGLLLRKPGQCKMKNNSISKWALWCWENDGDFNEIRISTRNVSTQTDIRICLQWDFNISLILTRPSSFPLWVRRVSERLHSHWLYGLQTWQTRVDLVKGEVPITLQTVKQKKKEKKTSKILLTFCVREGVDCSFSSVEKVVTVIESLFNHPSKNMNKTVED